MNNNIVHLGLDVHKDSIFAALYNPETKELCFEKQLPNQPKAIRKLIERIRQRFGEPRACYEASSCGFVLYHLLNDLGLHCEVIAPSSIPRRSGDRIKTDRRDAIKLATLHAAGLLTAVRVPDPEDEAARAIVRCRTALVEDLTRAKHRTTQLLLTRGLSFQGTNWCQAFHAWVAKIQLTETAHVVLQTYLAQVAYLESQIQALENQIEHLSRQARYAEPVAVLRAFRGIETLTAMTLLLEIGDIRRFDHPRKLMAYLGLVPSEHSSGERVYRGSITKAGNTHARKALVSAAWKYAARPRRSHPLKRRQAQLPAKLAAPVLAISWKAQNRLYRRFHALCMRKERSVAAVAIARELVGFLWEAMQIAETPQRLAA